MDPLQRSLFLLLQSTHRMVIQYDRTIGHLYVPNLRARIPSELGGYYVTTNAQGFRSEIDFAGGQNGGPRILFFGDSNVAGDGCDNRQRFSDLLGHELGAETYNYGLSGSAPDQHVLILEELARAVRADLIVLGVVVHNIERIKVGFRESIERTTGRRVLVPKPYFTLDEGTLRLHNSPVPRERPPVDGSMVAFETGLRDSQRYQSTRILRLYGRFPALHRLAQPISSELKAEIKRRLLRWNGFQPHQDYAEPMNPTWQLMEALLRRFCEAANGVPILLVPIPTKEYLSGEAEPIYQTLYERLEDPSRRVHVANLTSRLLALPKATRRSLTFARDAHFSPYGHRVLADALAAEIRQRRLLPSGSVTSRSSVSPPGSGDGKPRQPLWILGLSCFYHNSAACLIKDGEIVAAAEEERFSRIKNDRNFPSRAANYCLEEAGINQDALSNVVYYDNAPLTFERILHSHLAAGEEGRDSWLRMLPPWVRYKLDLTRFIRGQLHYTGSVLHNLHHRSHAASAFFPSPFERAAILTVDGVGEWATASLGHGSGNEVTLLKEMHFPHSLGLLYSAFTHFTGFKVNSGEYKMMGLAPYGEPRYVKPILDHLVDLKEDGSVELHLEYFGFLAGVGMVNERFERLFGGPARHPESRITRREMDLARSIQVVTEESILRMARHAHRLTGESRLCLAGGVALNCVANGRLLREGPFADIWIQPAAGDAGGALGAALDTYHTYHGHPRKLSAGGRPAQRGSCWGPGFTDGEIRGFLDTHGYPYHHLDPSTRAQALARYLLEGKVLGHFAGRTEFGPRALGARSILGDARRQEMQAKLNLKIKYRESFRPFAPTVLAERVAQYFELDRESPYMLLVAAVRPDRRIQTEPPEGDDLLPVVRQARSDIPAVTHVDYSARIQTIAREDHPEYYDVVKAFEEASGTGVIVNTSFNVRGEPIVNTPYDAYRCFMRTEMDVLALGNYVLLKHEQPTWPEEKGHVERDAEPAGRSDDRLAAGLTRIFNEELMPAARELRGQSRAASRFEGRSTTWRDAAAVPDPQALFLPPAEAATGTPDPGRLAEAIATSWQPGAVSSRLKQVLVQLIELGQGSERPDASDVEEQVPDSVYVMY